MQVQARVEFTDPSDYPISITLTGPLSGFEKLRSALSRAIHDNKTLPFYEVDNLVEALDQAARAVRRSIEISDSRYRRMTGGDIGFLWSSVERRA